MTTLVISDLHLTEKTTEAYRWEIFKTVRAYLKSSKVTIDHLFILGDLLDKKDRHPAELVNHLVDELVLTKEFVSEIYILKGNHDYLKPQSPFLDFLRHFDEDGIKWISTPTYVNFGKRKTLWLPHSRNPLDEWNNLDFKSVDVVFMHQSVIGCKVSEFYEMNCGFELDWLTSQLPEHHRVYSGDIHVPQEIKTLTYIGTPHPVSFGDTYQHNMILLNENFTSFTRIKTNVLQRHSLKIKTPRCLERLKSEGLIRVGDQAKIKIQLTNKELSSWSTTKENVIHWCELNQVDLFDLSMEKLDSDSELTVNSTENRFSFVDPKTAFTEFTKTEKIDKKIVAIGETILNDLLEK